MKFWILLLLLLLLPSSSFGQNTSDNGATPEPNSRVEVKFRLYRNYLIVVQGSLGQLDRLNFLVDTGANPTVVDRRVAKKLNLVGDVGKLDLLDESVPVQEAVLPAIQLGPVRVKFKRCIVQDLSSLERNLSVRIDAIVGIDVLGAESFSVNYESRKIIFGTIEPLPFSVPFESAPPKPTVQLQVNDGALRLLLDTGAQDLLLFGCSLHNRLGELAVLGLKKTSSTRDLPFDVQEARLSQVRLGDADLGSTRVYIVPGSQSCGWSFGGVMGMRAFGFKEVGFDFEGNRFSFKK